MREWTVTCRYLACAARGKDQTVRASSRPVECPQCGSCHVDTWHEEIDAPEVVERIRAQAASDRELDRSVRAQRAMTR